ncbi:MAG: cytochrome P450 [Anaerolineales bacterium]
MNDPGADSQASGPKGWPFLGNMLEARRAPLAFTDRLSQDFGPVAAFHLGPYRGYLVSHPHGVRHVLQDNHRNYDKQNYDYEMLRPFLGDGLITSDGEHWLRERRLIQPAFHKDHLATLANTINRSTQRMLDSWDARSGRALAITQEMNRLALINVSKGVLGAEVEAEGDRILRAFSVLNREVARRFQSILPLPLWIPSPTNLKARNAIAKIDQALESYLQRAADEGLHHGMLRLLFQAHGGEAGDKADKQLIRDELATMILAGHETTGSLLSWTWYLLAKHETTADRVYQEVDHILAGRLPNYTDLPNLVFLESVLKEALRLYPPVWIISRRAKRKDQVLGRHIPEDSVVILSPYATHRLPDYWEAPDRFMPERFSRGAEEARPPFAYFPFGGGPRYCIGADFAMMETKMVVASVVQRFRLELAGETTVRPEAMVTLRPRGRLLMNAIPVSS